MGSSDRLELEFRVNQVLHRMVYGKKRSVGTRAHAEDVLSAVYAAMPLSFRVGVTRSRDISRVMRLGTAERIAARVRALKYDDYTHLQRAYSLKGDIIPLRLMTRDERAEKLAEFRHLVAGTNAHAREFREWCEVNPPAGSSL